MKTALLRFLLSLCLVSAPLLGQAATYYQSAPGNSASIQGLVDRAQSGDVIILRAGSHYVTTPIRLSAGKNSITIRGEQGAVVRKAPNSYNAAAFEITGNYNTIDKIELDGGNLPEAGIIIYGQHNTVSNSSVHNCGNSTAVGGGILLDGGHTVCALNTVIGCKVYYNYMVGISQNRHSDGTVRDNQIYENGAEGLTVDIASHNNYIYNNWIHLNNTGNRGVGGVGTDAANGNRFDSNTIDYTHYRSGLTFQNNIGGCDGVIVINNHINNNDGYGILERWTQYRDTNMRFQNNELLNNRQGTQTIIYSDRPTEVLPTATVQAAGAAAIFPNPARDYIGFDLSALTGKPLRVIILDLRGRRVFEQVLTGSMSFQVLRPVALADGLYVVRVYTARETFTQKLLLAQ